MRDGPVDPVERVLRANEGMGLLAEISTDEYRCAAARRMLVAMRDAKRREIAEQIREGWRARAVLVRMNQELEALNKRLAEVV